MESDEDPIHSSEDESEASAPPKKRAKVIPGSRVANRVRNPSAKKKQAGKFDFASMSQLQSDCLPIEDETVKALEKQLTNSKKAGSKKDQEIARLKAQLEDRADERRARFPNGSPKHSDVESEDEIGGNTADSVIFHSQCFVQSQLRLS